MPRDRQTKQTAFDFDRLCAPPRPNRTAVRGVIMGPHFTVGVATGGQKVKVPYWSSGCLGVQKGSLGGVTGDFEALHNVSTVCPVLGRGAGIIELF